MTKSSDAKSSSQPKPVFFIDRSLGQEVVASRLRDAGYQVEIHDKHFKPDSPDEEWIAEVGRRNWVILTKDNMILHRSAELLAVLKGGARLYTLVKGNINAKQMADIFIKAAPKIEKSIEHQEPPYIAKIHSTGKVEIWMTGKQLRKQFGN